MSGRGPYHITESPAARGARSGGPRRRKNSKLKTITVFVTVFLVALLIFSGVTAVVLLLGREESEDTGTAVSENTSYTPANFLLICEDEVYGTGFLLIRTDYKAKKLPVLSLPPEMMVNYRENYKSLKEHMSYGGINQAVGAISELLSIDIDYYARFAAIELESFIDQLGGIEFPLGETVYYGAAGASQSVLEAGNQRLTGNMVSGILASSSIERIKRNNYLTQFAVYFINQYLKSDVLLKMESIYGNFVNKVTTNIRINDIFYLIPALESFVTTENPAYAFEVDGGFTKLGEAYGYEFSKSDIGKILLNFDN